MIKLKQTGTNQHTVTVGDLDLFFSYETVIGFRHNYVVVVSENIWSKATARHLAALPCDKEDRVPNDVFNKKLEDLIEEGSING